MRLEIIFNQDMYNMEIAKVTFAAAFVVIVLGVIFYLSNECEKKNGILHGKGKVRMKDKPNIFVSVLMIPAFVFLLFLFWIFS